MGEVARATRCPDCGAVLPPDSPQGLCPRCLLASSASIVEPASIVDPPSMAESAACTPEPASDVSSALGAAWRALSGTPSGDSSVTDAEDFRPPHIPRYEI